jgi:hypothetical protein
MMAESAGHPGGAMIRSRSREGWRSRLGREWILILFTAAATAFFAVAGGYIATVSVENKKVRSGNIIKLSDDFQTRFSVLMRELQKFTAASVKQTKIPEQEQADLAASVLNIQLMMSPATGRWPASAYSQADQFFRDLADFDKVVRGAGSFAELENIDKIVNRLVFDDLALMREMQAEAEIHYFPLW